MNRIAPLIQKMIAYNHGDAKRISHALKVHNYAKTIAILEKVNEYDLFNLESAAILHDIGINVCEQKYNACNTRIRSNNTSGVTGVSKHKQTNKWRAYIEYNQKYIHLGLFNTKEEAIKARKEAELKYFGEYRYQG